MRYIYIILTVLILSSVCNAVPFQIFPPPPPASPNTPAVAQAKSSIRGQVVDEKGKPQGEVLWRISGIEELRDGKWTQVIYLGLPTERITDSNGFFAVPFNRPCRYDLQFYKEGFAPAFLFQVATDSPGIKVILKRGERIHGIVSQRVDGKLVPLAAETVVLRLPSRDFWYQDSVVTDKAGKFEFRACAPPIDPTGLKRKWQVVLPLPNQIVEIDVQDGRPVDEVNIEVQ
jgi:hypothetical protein